MSSLQARLVIFRLAGNEFLCGDRLLFGQGLSNPVLDSFTMHQFS